MKTSSWVISTCRSAICAPASALACDLAARSAPACGRAACGPAERYYRPWAALHHLQQAGAEILCGCAIGTSFDTVTVLQLRQEVRMRSRKRAAATATNISCFRRDVAPTVSSRHANTSAFTSSSDSCASASFATSCAAASDARLQPLKCYRPVRRLPTLQYTLKATVHQTPEDTKAPGP